MSNLIIPDGSGTKGTLGDDELPVTPITPEEARLLREYKKFLMRHGLREALYCSNCWQGEKEDGCKAFVTDADILIACRCTMRVHKGQTF
jgi:hypothetical protein